MIEFSGPTFFWRARIANGGDRLDPQIDRYYRASLTRKSAEIAAEFGPGRFRNAHAKFGPNIDRLLDKNGRRVCR